MGRWSLTAAHAHAFQDDRTERASLDRINRAKEHWRAYVQGRAELELMRNKQTILLSAWPFRGSKGGDCFALRSA
ncbi:MAG: hypothetical protein V3U08_08540 [Nitrospirales bacterium]